MNWKEAVLLLVLLALGCMTTYAILEVAKAINLYTQLVYTLYQLKQS